MFRRWLYVATVCTLAVLLTPGESQAQRFGRYGRGGRYGSGYYGGGYGSGYNQYGYGQYGYGSPYASGGYGIDPSSYAGIQPSGQRSFYYTPGQAGPSQASQNPNVATLEVRVPDGAEIWIEGDKTSMTGTMRRFTSPALEPGKSYTYDVKAKWTDSSGKEVERTRTVKVAAGARVGVDFNTQQ